MLIDWDISQVSVNFVLLKKTDKNGTITFVQSYLNCFQGV